MFIQLLLFLVGEPLVNTNYCYIVDFNVGCCLEDADEEVKSPRPMRITIFVKCLLIHRFLCTARKQCMNFDCCSSGLGRLKHPILLHFVLLCLTAALEPQLYVSRAYYLFLEWNKEPSRKWWRIWLLNISVQNYEAFEIRPNSMMTEMNENPAIQFNRKCFTTMLCSISKLLQFHVKLRNDSSYSKAIIPLNDLQSRIVEWQHEQNSISIHGQVRNFYI